MANLSYRCFIVDDATGALKKVSAKKAMDAWQGHGSWPEMAGKTIRVLALLCQQERGVISKVTSVHGYRVHVLPNGQGNGQVSMDHVVGLLHGMVEDTRATVDAESSGTPVPKKDSEQIFKAKQLHNSARWEPDQKQTVAAMRLLKLAPPAEVQPTPLLPGPFG